MCRVLSFMENADIWIVDFVLCPCNMNVKVDSWSEFLLQLILIFHDNTSLDGYLT